MGESYQIILQNKQVDLKLIEFDISYNLFKINALFS